MNAGRTPTGIRGLDTVLQGGYPVNSSLALKAEPSNVTEYFQQQFVAEGLKQGSQAIYCCVCRSAASAINSMRHQGFDVLEPVANDQLIFVDCYTGSKRMSTIGVDKALQRKVIVVENPDDERLLQAGLASAVERVTSLKSLRAVCESVPATLSAKSAIEMMRWGRKTFGDLRAFSTVTMHTFPTGMRRELLEAMAQDFDGVMELRSERAFDRVRYYLDIHKMRMCDPLLRLHELDVEKAQLMLKTVQKIT